MRVSFFYHRQMALFRMTVTVYSRFSTSSFSSFLPYDINRHIPVLMKPLFGDYIIPKIIELNSSVDNKAQQNYFGPWFLDATFGNGGMTKMLLELGVNVVAVDRDPMAISNAKVWQKILLEKERGLSSNENYPIHFPKLIPIFGKFSQLSKITDQLILEKSLPNQFRGFDGVIFDVGLNSDQISKSNRGFSFRLDGPLDMRMSRPITNEEDFIKPESFDLEKIDALEDELSAYDIVNFFSEKQIEQIISEYGQDPNATRIASAISNYKRNSANLINSTMELTKIILGAIPHRFYKKSNRRLAAGVKSIHPATRTFQALRIYVNDELNELRKGLQTAGTLLKSKGQLYVISFHSLEDKIVKDYLQTRSVENSTDNSRMEEFTILTKRPIMSTEQEIRTNPRCRSAKLRIAEKV